MELKGKVILDEESMDELKAKIRQEIVNVIKEDGFDSSEIEQFLNECNYEYYIQMIIQMIRCTIGNVISKTNKENIHWNSEKRTYQKLLAIKSIVDI